MKIVSIVVFLLFLFQDRVYAQTTSGRPNIVLIVADDLGYGDIEAYGQQKIKTPNLNKLAKGGLLFRQFYAGTSVCAPSRASLMTGQHTGHTPVRGNKGMQPEGQTPLPDSSLTFVNGLQDAGYATAAFGKWGMGFITTSGAPNKKGFDRFFGYNCQSLAHDYYPDHLWDNDTKVELQANTEGDSIYSADLIHRKAIDYLNSVDNKPFFLFLPYTLPHGDVILPHDAVYNHYIKKFNESSLPRPAKSTGKNKTFEPYPHAAFAAMIDRLDRYVGEVVKTLEAKGLIENTLIIFTSDNGPHRENGGDPEFFNGSGSLRGIKRDLYEGGIRVPFIASWKGKIVPGSTDQPAALWDLYPTFLQMAGISSTKKIDGLSLLPILTNKGIQQQHEYFYWEFHENNGRQAVRWKNWKAVKMNVRDPAAKLELFDLDKDPAEKNNIADDNPQILARLEGYIRHAHVPNKDWPLLSSEIK
jgi:arylsulfatase A-like enzyme